MNHELTDCEFMKLLFMYDCYLYGDFVVNNISNLTDIKIKKGDEIKCFAPHIVLSYIERSLSGVVTYCRRDFTFGLSYEKSDKNILMTKLYQIRLGKKEFILYVTYTFTDIPSMPEWTRKIDPSYTVFDTDMLFLSRNGLNVYHTISTVKRTPDPLIRILSNCKDKLYIVEVSENQLSNEGIRDMVLNRILEKKLSGWKNIYSDQLKPALTNDKCSICLEKIKEGSNAFNSGVCQHVTHTKCMNKLIIQELTKKKIPTCPLCRKPIPLLML